MSRSDILDAICRDNLDELRTLVSTQKCSDTQDLRNTLLYEAVKENKKAITEFLLQVGSNPNSKVYSYWSIGSTALHIAARNGNLQIIEILLNHGADINAKDAVGSSPLVYAIKNDKDDATELLLERGARLYSDNEGRSPLHVAATRGSLKITKILLQNGAPVNAVITAGFEKGYTPLHCACSSYRFDIDIIEFLLSNGAGVDLKSECGLTPLHIASQIGNVQLINLLLNHNSDIDRRANNGYTPLYWAIEFEKEGAALLLINRGAKVNDELSNGKTILRLALRWGLSSTVEEILTRCPDPQGEIEKCKNIFENLSQEMINILLKYCFHIEFFHIAIREGYIQIIESVLKDRLDLTANVDDSSLHIAVKSGQIESVEVLIAHGAVVNSIDETGMTPLLYTPLLTVEDFLTSSQISYEAAVKIAKMLLTAGADVNAATRTEKLTPLHLACERSRPNLVQVFLDHNADVNLRDKNGKTALHFAIDSNNCNVVKLLFKFGADINILNCGPIYYGDTYRLTLNHALALEAINLYDAKDLRSSLSKLYFTDQIDMESRFENCKQEIEKLKFVKVPGSQLTCYALMTRSIHSLASYIKNEDLIIHFQSDDITFKFPIYAPIIEGRLRNAFQRRPLICGAGEFLNYYLKLPHVCVDYILSCLSSDDLKNVKDAM